MSELVSALIVPRLLRAAAYKSSLARKISSSRPMSQHLPPELLSPGNQSLLHCIKGFLQETLDDRTALLASSLQEVEQTLHEKSRSILKGELDLSSQIHKLADDILQLRGELKAFMSHAGYQPCVCNPLEGDPPDLDLGWVPLNKRPSVRYGVWPLLMLVR